MKQRIPFIKSLVAQNAGITNLRFFSINASASPQLKLAQAREHSKYGRAPEAEVLYRELIELTPQDETPYRELFKVWCQNRSVLGLTHNEIEWLQNKFDQNFPSDDEQPDMSLKT